MSPFRRALLLPLLVASAPAMADHLPGGSITYRCLGGNSYEVTLALYRDCSGAPMQPQQLQFSNNCGVSFTATGLVPVSVEEVPPLCAGEAANSSCNGGTLPGIELFTYRHTLFLSPCPAWTIAWSTCCRQPSLNLAGAPGLYIEARLGNAGGLCTSSPELTGMPLPFVCTGQAVAHNAGAMAGPGLVLRHRLIDARYAAPAPTVADYLPPHYGERPWTGMAIDSITGRIAFTPSMQGRITTVVRVDQYDPEGVWLGSVMRDFLFVVTACGNTVPPASGGTINAVTGNGVLTGARTAQVCARGSACVQTFFSDPDPGQSLSVSLHVPPPLFGALLSVSGSNPAAVSVCWDSLGVPPGDHWFTITVADDACPLIGSQTYTYLLRATPLPYPGADGVAQVCALAEPFALIDSLGGFPPPGGAWTAPDGSPHNGLFRPASDPPGPYAYTVTGFPNCPASVAVDVSFRPPAEPDCVRLNVPDIGMAGPSLFPNPTSGLLMVRDLPVDGPLQLALHDMRGRMVWATGARAVEGTVQMMVPPSIETGGYVLLLTGHDGGILLRGRLSIER